MAVHCSQMNYEGSLKSEKTILRFLSQNTDLTAKLLPQRITVKCSSSHTAAWNWGWDRMWSYYTEFWKPRWKFLTNCCTERGLRLHIIILDTNSNAKKRLFSSFAVWKRGLDHMWKRSIIWAGFLSCRVLHIYCLKLYTVVRVVINIYQFNSASRLF